MAGWGYGPTKAKSMETPTRRRCSACGEMRETVGNNRECVGCQAKRWVADREGTTKKN